MGNSCDKSLFKCFQHAESLVKVLVPSTVFERAWASLCLYLHLCLCSFIQLAEHLCYSCGIVFRLSPSSNSFPLLPC